MATPTPYEAYQNATQTVGEMQQLLMLYDGAINFIQQGKEAIRDKRYSDRWKLIQRASAIVNGLCECLDHEKNAETAQALHNFYEAIDMQLINVHLTDNVETCDRVIDQLRTLREAWKNAIDEVSVAANKEAPALPKKAEADDNAAPESEVTVTA